MGTDTVPLILYVHVQSLYSVGLRFIGIGINIRYDGGNGHVL